MPEFPKLGLTEIMGETRVVGEFLRFEGDVMADRNLRKASANWHPALLIPGFMVGDASLYPLGARLWSAGHRVFYSGIWMNADCPHKTLNRLTAKLHEVTRRTGRKVVLIGHSLGGIYAREVARRDPALVERAILLGAPIKHSENATPYLRPFIAAMRLMHARCVESMGSPCAICGLDLPEAPPKVPETVIYTKSDGIVEWHSCLEHGPKIECIEVDSSHCGLPLNLKTWEIILERLAIPPSTTDRVEAPRNAAKRQSLPHRRKPSHLRLVSCRLSERNPLARTRKA
jgi:triacylglycerol lipase